MSPRRRIQPGEEPILNLRVPETRRWWAPSRGWRLPLTMSIAAVIAAAAITACSLILVGHESHLHAESKEHRVLIFVRSFLTDFASLDPFHANDYVDHLLAQSTGEFAKQYRENENEILVQVARAEPTKGTILDAGVERWNDDGSANVLAITEVTTKSPDGQQVVETTNRWVVTAQQEGNQWKISSLTPVL
jgi:Mce-associated membrane protein